jgi:hypothetical protein
MIHKRFFRQNYAHSVLTRGISLLFLVAFNKFLLADLVPGHLIATQRINANVSMLASFPVSTGPGNASHLTSHVYLHHAVTVYSSRCCCYYHASAFHPRLNLH